MTVTDGLRTAIGTASTPAAVSKALDKVFSQGKGVTFEQAAADV